MGGIAGLINLDGAPAQEQELKRMALLLAHRGLNGRGVHAEGTAGIVHTRHAVLDLSDRAHQPMQGAGKRYWITFDGTLYNFLELKKELKGLGYPFRTESDTEVVLAAYIAWGPACLDRFEGMWAFAVWDAQERKFFLSRDRFGIKPLYFYHKSQLFAFASEIKGFLGLEHVEMSFDQAALGKALDSKTAERLWKGIESLLPGCYLEISEKQPRPVITRWWKILDHLPLINPWPAKQAETLKELLFDACGKTILSDVPVGCVLGEGIGSRALIAVVHDLSHQVKEVIRQASDCSTVCVKEPFSTQEIKWLKGLKVKAYLADKEPLVNKLEELIFAYEIMGPLGIEDWSVYCTLRNALVRVGIEESGAAACFAAIPQSSELWVEELEEELQAARTGNFLSEDKKMGRSFDHQVEWLEGVSFQEHLRRQDLAGMANSVEVRMPFLDWKIVTFCLALSFSQKMDYNLLKHAMKEIIPKPLLVVKKIPKEPLHDFLNPLIKEVVERKAFSRSTVADFSHVKELVENQRYEKAWPYVQAYILDDKFRQARQKVFDD